MNYCIAVWDVYGDYISYVVEFGFQHIERRIEGIQAPLQRVWSRRFHVKWPFQDKLRNNVSQRYFLQKLMNHVVLHLKLQTKKDLNIYIEYSE